jgi:osmotically inducible lipoprotein OsmB
MEAFMTVFRTAAFALILGLGLAGCQTWDKLGPQEKGTVAGAGIGAAGGAVLSKGSAVGTAAGAAVGGVVGNQVGKHQENK